MTLSRDILEMGRIILTSGCTVYLYRTKMYSNISRRIILDSSSNSTSVEELYTTESGTMLDYLTKNDKILLVSLESFLIVRIVSLPIKKIEVQIKI